MRIQQGCKPGHPYLCEYSSIKTSNPNAKTFDPDVKDYLQHKLITDREKSYLIVVAIGKIIIPGAPRSSSATPPTSMLREDTDK